MFPHYNLSPTVKIPTRLMCYSCPQLTVVKDQLMIKFLVDDEDVLVDTATREFEVNAPIYVGGVPRGFLSPSDTLVRE